MEAQTFIKYGEKAAELLFLLNTKIAEGNRMLPEIAAIREKWTALEHQWDEKTRLFTPYLVEMETPKYYDGHFKGNLEPVKFLTFQNGSWPGDEEFIKEAEQLLEDVENQNRIYNVYYLALEELVFGMEQVIFPELDVLIGYYAAIQMAARVRRKEKHPEKQGLGFYPRLSGFNNLLEKKQEQFLKHFMAYWCLGSSILTSDILLVPLGQIRKEHHITLLRMLKKLRELRKNAAHCRMIPQEEPQLVPKRFELFHEDKLIDRVGELKDA